MQLLSTPAERTSVNRCAAASGELPGIPGYTIHRAIGVGHAAVIYLADDDRRGGKVALKVLKECGDKAGATRRGFAAECAILSGIRHRHVVRAIEHQANRKPCYLAMEYLAGGTLRERMRRGLSGDEAISLLRQAADGVAAVHGRALVHRDIKPENFLFRTTGDLVLADFGVVAQAGDAASAVAPGRLIGTPCYAAPEQGQGEPPSAAADVYSLGVMLHEMLCGFAPFRGQSVLEVLAQHLVAPVPSLPQALAGYQPLINRMLEKHASKRLPDADAVLQEIEPMTLGAPSAAG